MSNLYMTTEEFAQLVVNALDDQNYFKKGTKAHPEDLAMAFSTVAETIGSAMTWAITKEHEVKKKQAVMRTSTLAKNNYHVKTYYNDASGTAKVVLPQDEEVAPALLEPGESVIPEEYALGYSEWKHNKKVR
jgi:hypothetical protein